MRVTQETYVRQTIYDLLKTKEDQYRLNEQIATGVRINSPSDDPVASIKVADAHLVQKEIDQYSDTVSHAIDWLRQAESSLGSISDILTQAKVVAEQMATGSYDSSQREATSAQVQGFIEQIISLANTQVAGSFIFAGTENGEPAVSLGLSAENPAEPAAGNTGSGLFYGLGDYTGRLSRDIEITVAAVDVNDTPTSFNYSYVDDLGRTVSGTADIAGTGPGQAVAVGDGISVYVDPGDFVAGETYTLTIGRQRGNDNAIQASLSWNNRLQYNYTTGNVFGDEGNSGGAWGNLLDTLSQWQWALAWDSQTQDDGFEAVGAMDGSTSYVDPSTTGKLNVTGDWNELNRRDFEFNVGGPFQTVQDDSTLLTTRNYQFTVDAAYAGGVPSAANPMTVNYTYTDDFGFPQVGVAVITGAGPASAVTLDPPADGTDLYVANSSYTGGEVFGFLPLYAAGTTPSAANPLNMTYTYTDDSGVRQRGQVTFTGTGSGQAQTLNPPGASLGLTLSDGGTFAAFDAWDLTLEQYHQGQERSQTVLEGIESLQSNLLKYVADAGARLNRLEVRENLFQEDTLRLDDRLTYLEDTDVAFATTELKMQETIYQATLQATALISSRNLADYL